MTTNGATIMKKDLKYLLAYAVPASVFLSIYLRGYASFFAVGFLFVLLPLMELVLPGTRRNYSPEEESHRLKIPYFDYLLYLNVPIQLGLMGFFLWTVATVDLATYEYVGLILSMGMACGALGINVAHELGHRTNRLDQVLSQILLLTSLYLHFFIEHNRGHHKHVATPHDPATSRQGETVYAFYWRSISGGFRSAWRLECERLEKKGLPAISFRNLMLRFQLIQLLALAVIGWLTGPMGLLAFVGAAVIGILELETVNYLEHYGLMRKEIRPGVYERVQPWHSWNSNHSIGRIMLYELTRHSDHHYMASRKYQVLRHFHESPELPSGYPAMMLLSLVPPVWFRLMDRRLAQLQRQSL
jgi:alkane 1-monooxygenase